uniref:Uncharacterized protein n=1 Tax=Acrobeloides nanus TaxID=290746 RepID=A0A914D556_9BILA
MPSETRLRLRAELWWLLPSQKHFHASGMRGVETVEVIKLTWIALPHLEKTKGNIVNISSVGSLKTFPTAMYYVTAKAALDHFTKNIASVVGPKGVRVNSLNPGAIETNFITRHGVSAEKQKEIFDSSIIPNTPLRRVGVPEDMANILLFLASDQASFMTGSIVVADGGRLVYTPGTFELK